MDFLLRFLGKPKESVNICFKFKGKYAIRLSTKLFGHPQVDLHVQDGDAREDIISAFVAKRLSLELGIKPAKHSEFKGLDVTDERDWISLSANTPIEKSTEATSETTPAALSDITPKKGHAEAAPETPPNVDKPFETRRLQAGADEDDLPLLVLMQRQRQKKFTGDAHRWTSGMKQNRGKNLAFKTDMLLKTRAGVVTVEDGAMACGLSENYFSRLLSKKNIAKGMKQVQAMAAAGLQNMSHGKNGNMKPRQNALGQGRKPCLPTLRQRFAEEITKAVLVHRKRVPYHVAKTTMIQMCREIYPQGAAHAEVRSYLRSSFPTKPYERIRNGQKQVIEPCRRVEPGRKLLNRLLQEISAVVKRPNSMRQRSDSIEDRDEVWPNTIRVWRNSREAHKIPLKNLKDGDEQCCFFEGNMGWSTLQHCIGFRGVSLSCKARASFKKTMSCMWGTTAVGKVIPPVFCGKKQDFGKEGPKCRKLASIREYKFGDGSEKLSDYSTITSNEAGWFNGQLYSESWLNGSLRRWIEEHELDPNYSEVDTYIAGLNMDDACTAHSGQTKGDGNLLPGGLSKKDFLRQNHQIHIDCPAGYTSYRPQDQRWINYLVQYKYVHFIQEMCGLVDFRSSNSDYNIQPHHVVTAFLLALRWLESHPECIVAAWLESGLVTAEDYEDEGLHDLLFAAQEVRSGKRAEIQDCLKEHRQALWDRDAVMTMSVMADLQSAHAQHPSSEKDFAVIDWLRPQTDTKPSVGRQEPPDETGIITGKAAQKRKLQELVSVAKNRVAEERRELEHKKNQRQDAAMEKAAMACMGAAARKIRLVGKQKPKCFKACHGVWHCEGCPNHHRNVSIAKKALARRAFKVRIAQTFCASLGQLLINRCFFTVSWVSFCFSLKIQKKV